MRTNVNPEIAEGSKPNVRPLTGEQEAGVKLARYLLWIISILLVIFSAVFFTSNFETPDQAYNLLSEKNVSDTVFNKRIDQVRVIVQEKKDYRDFVTRNFQYIIGVLLPILTSILGYIFGTKAKE